MGQAVSSLCPNGGGGTVGGYSSASSANLSWLKQGGASKAIQVQCRVTQSVAGSYFCLIGFNGGYMGIQDRPTWGGSAKSAIFSLWDQGGTPQNLFTGSGVDQQRFGGEGTGIKYLEDGAGWQVGENVTCMVIFGPSSGGANYGAYYKIGNRGWKHMASVFVPGAVDFNGFYSFVEDFVRNGASAMETRKAVFGNAWTQDTGGTWNYVNGCRFGQSTAGGENVPAVDTNAFGDSERTIETGGVLNGAFKVDSIFPLAAGSPKPSWSNLPSLDSWF